jgi:hypothetical protein
VGSAEWVGEGEGVGASQMAAWTVVVAHVWSRTFSLRSLIVLGGVVVALHKFRSTSTS